MLRGSFSISPALRALQGPVFWAPEPVKNFCSGKNGAGFPRERRRKFCLSPAPDRSNTALRAPPVLSRLHPSGGLPLKVFMGLRGEGLAAERGSRAAWLSLGWEFPECPDLLLFQSNYIVALCYRAEKELQEETRRQRTQEMEFGAKAKPQN